MDLPQKKGKGMCREKMLLSHQFNGPLKFMKANAEYISPEVSIKVPWIAFYISPLTSRPHNISPDCLFNLS